LRWVLRDIRKLTEAAKSIGNGEPFHPSISTGAMKSVNWRTAFKRWSEICAQIA